MDAYIIPGLQKFFYALSWTFLHSLWQCSLIAIVAGLIVFGLQKSKADIKYSVWIGAALLFLAVNVFTFYKHVVYYNQQEVSVSVQLSANHEEAIITPTPNSNQSLVQEEISLNPFISGFINYINNNLYPIILIWFIGMLVMLFRFLGGLGYLLYLKNKNNFNVEEYWLDLLQNLKAQAGIKKSISLVESSLANTVMVIGHLKPVILFPMGLINKLDPKDVEGILSHELAHIRRNDFLINILQSILEIIYYFNPAVWYISNKVREEREISCDEFAVSMCGDSLQYARSLVLLGDIQQSRTPLSLSAIGSNKFQLLHRVQRMLGSEKYTQSVFERIAVSIGIILFLMIWSFNSLLNAKTNNSQEITQSNTNLYQKIDSFLLAKKVSDGTYTYKDHNLSSEFVVKDNRVVTLRFNGVELNPNDFPKFEKYFYNIIAENYSPQTPSTHSMSTFSTPKSSSKTTQFTTGSGTSAGNSPKSSATSNFTFNGETFTSDINYEDYIDLEPGKYTISNKKGFKTIISKYEDGTMQVQELKDDKIIKDYFRDEEGNISTTLNVFNSQDTETTSDNSYKEEKQEYLDLIDQLKNELLLYNSVQEDRIDAKKKLTKELEKLSKSIESKLNENAELQSNLANKYCQLKNTVRQLVDRGYYYTDQYGNSYQSGGQNYKWGENGPDTKNNISYSNNHQSKEDKEWKSKMIKALEEDGYIDEGESIQFKWQKGIMRINSRKISDKDHDRYIKIYEKAFDTKVKNEKEFSYFWNETR